VAVIVSFFSLPVRSESRRRRSYSSRIKSAPPPSRSLARSLSLSFPLSYFRTRASTGGEYPGTVKYVSTYTHDTITLCREICQRASRIRMRLSRARNTLTMVISSTRSTASTCRICSSTTMTIGGCCLLGDGSLIGFFGTPNVFSFISLLDFIREMNENIIKILLA